MRLRLRGAAMAAHKWCGGEAAAAELAVDEAAAREAQRWPRTSMRRWGGSSGAGCRRSCGARGAAMAAHKYRGGGAASERRSDGRAQVLRRRSGSSGAGCS